jgi:hypothetical protein
MEIFIVISGVSFVIHPILFPSFYADEVARFILQVVGLVCVGFEIKTIVKIIKSIGKKTCLK